MRPSPSRRPRHRRPGRARWGSGGTGSRTSGRAGSAFVLAVLLILGLGTAAPATNQAGPVQQDAALTGVPAGPFVATSAAVAARAVAAENARWEAVAREQADQLARESVAVAAAALDAAEGVDPLRIAPAPPPELVDLDRAVADLRAASGMLTQGTGSVPVNRDVETVAHTVTHGSAAPAASGLAGSSALARAMPARTVPARVAAAGMVQAAAADVFRLSLAVERSGPPATTETHQALDVAGLTALEDKVAAAKAAADALSRGLGSGPTVRGGSASAVSGPLRADGTADPVGLCPLPFVPGSLLRCDAADALVRLNEVFRAEHGKDLPVGGTYRSFEEQVAVKQAKGSLAATPGSSHHGWGVAVDFSGFGGVGQFDSPLYAWMMEHGPAFGWEHPEGMGPGGSGPLEPWHWEYARAPVAEHVAARAAPAGGS